MSFTWTASGWDDIWSRDWILAPCADQFMREVSAHPVFGKLYCVGTLGNAEHHEQGNNSDHNPFIQGPNGKWYVRAVDLAGDHDTLMALRAQLIWHGYAMHDPRLWPFGYGKGPDSLINDWSDAVVIRSHVDTGDEGHLHISWNRSGTLDTGPTNRWIPALDSRAPWFTDWTSMAEADIIKAVNAHVDVAIAKQTHDILTMLIYGDSKEAALHIPVKGKVPAQGHPRNLSEIWDTANLIRKKLGA